MWPEGAVMAPVADVLFLISVLCFLAGAIAVAVRRLPREA
jgi:hypothetical protein